MSVAADILVTLPPGHLQVIQDVECMVYFHRLGSGVPKRPIVGGRVFFVESGYIWGFARCSVVEHKPLGMRSVDGKRFGPGHYAIMDPASWHWIKPIPRRGFQGFRYSRLDEADVHVVGTYRDPRPDIEL